MRFENLDKETRDLMLLEMENDIKLGELYFSKHFNDIGKQIYPDLLKASIKDGDTETLANSIIQNNCLKDKTERKTKSGISMVSVPKNAHETLAQGEFNRFYMRAVCRKAIKENREVQVYRGRHSNKPRTASTALIGKNLNPQTLLDDLKVNIGTDTALGLPPGPNSGLTIKLT